LNSKTSERRGVDLWLGSIWFLDHAVLPLFIGVLGRLLGEKIQKKLDSNNQLKASQESNDSQETKVHADIKVIDGKLSAEIKYNGDADIFLKVIKSLYDEQQSP
jgi:hypothetical protein